MKKILLFMVCILAINLVSAGFDFDNIGNYEKGETEYGKYEIRNSVLGIPWWQLSKVAELELTENTKKCGNDCKAIIPLTLYERSAYVQDMKFKRNINGEWIETEIESYDLYIRNEDDKTPTYRKIDLEEEGDAGNYTLEVRARKESMWIVDWQIKNNGVWTEEWAIWGEQYWEQFLGTSKNTSRWNFWTTDSVNAPEGSITISNSLLNISYSTGSTSARLGYYSNESFEYTKTNVSYPKGALFFGYNLLSNHSFGAVQIPITDITNNAYGLISKGGTMYFLNNGTETAVTQSYTTNTFYVVEIDCRSATKCQICTYDADGITLKECSAEYDKRPGSFYPALGSGTNTPSSSMTKFDWIGIDTSFIILNSPADNYVSPITEIEFNASGTTTEGTTVVNRTIILYNPDGSINQTNFTAGLSGSTNTSVSNLTLTSGISYNWTAEYCDSDGDCGLGLENRTVSVDIDVPTLNITYPINLINITETNTTTDLNWTVSDLNLDSCWYGYNGTNTSVTCGDLNTTFQIAIGEDSILFYANDTLGNLAIDNQSWIYHIFIYDETYSSATTETANETFAINITYNSSRWTSFSTKLNYNGTEYTPNQFGAGDDRFYNVTINIPSGIGNNSFYWNFTINDGVVTNYLQSTTHNQTVSILNFTYCESGTPYINFTTKEAVSPFPTLNATFKSTWEIGISGSTSVVNYSYEDLSEGNNSWAFCILPADENYEISATIEYDKTDYGKNFYFITDAEYTNTTSNITLYLLNDTASTLTELKVVNAAQEPQENATIQIQYYDVGTDTFYTVGMARTDHNGRDIVYLNWYDTLYKFIILQNGIVTKSTTPYKIAETPQVFTIGDEFSYGFDKFQNFLYQLYYNNATQNFVLTYTKPSGLVEEGCLRVIKRNSTDDDEICGICETSSSATLYCNIASEGNGTFIATFYATGSLWVVDWISETIGVDFSDEIYELLGAEDATFYAFLFSGITTSMFLVSPILGIVGLIISLMGASLLGFTILNYTTYMFVVITGGIIIWLINR